MRKEHTKATLWTPEKAKAAKEATLKAISDGKLYQRSTSHLAVRMLAIDIANGAWDKHTHQGMALTTNNEILDGMHRNDSVIMSGKAIELPISVYSGTYAEYRELMKCFDRGKKRGIGQMLQIDGVKNGNKVAASARNIVGFFSNWALKSISLEQTEWVIEMYGQEIAASLRMQANGQAVGGSATNAATAILMKAAPETALEFGDKLFNGFGDKGDAPSVLRKWLASPTGRLATVRAVMAATFKAFVLYQSGTIAKKFIVDASGVTWVKTQEAERVQAFIKYFKLETGAFCVPFRPPYKKEAA